MPSFPSSFPADLKPRLREVIYQVQQEIQWKPGKGDSHLAKRISLGHLSSGATLAEYEAIIRAVLLHPEAEVYLFQFHETYYPAVAATYRGRVWLVMFGMNGVMETAFPPDQPDVYLQDAKYHLIGPIREILL